MRSAVPVTRTSAAETPTTSRWTRAHPAVSTAPAAVPAAMPTAPPTPSGPVSNGVPSGSNDDWMAAVPNSQNFLQLA